jgi:hypothetical protein
LTDWEMGLAEIEKSLTLCVMPVDALELKLLSPAYETANVFGPALANVIVHAADATVAVHESPVPSFTITLPVGVPLPGGDALTAKLTVTG